ncbi:hypothetical protein NLI96_g4107 [Meripilus lineatus]|uniref:MARVEL domain-containing protein n=1 Tax=Meripilus lineatus TaxID=2056292 RepID=A0AAD5V590_9APHY|nr:hypothetical protein NLI96_g4107 [Physisporinus lineatus]
MNLQWLPMARLGVLGAVSFFALITLATSAAYISTTLSANLRVDGIRAWPQTSADPFAAFDLVVALFTLLTLPAMIAIDFFRKGAFTSMIMVEAGWLSFLWVMWLAAAGFTVSSISNLLSLCSVNPGVSNLQGACRNTQAAAAFGFLSWLTLMAYSGGILVLAFLSQQRGVQVWRSSVRDAKFNAFSSNVPPVNASGGYYASVSTNYDGQNYPMTTGGTTPSGASGGYSNSGIGSGPYPLV